MNKQMRKIKASEEMRTYEECLNDYMFWRERLEMIKSYPILQTGYKGCSIETFQFAQDRLDKACRELLGV